MAIVIIPSIKPKSLTLESIITKLKINPKAHRLIANLKAVLTTDELRYDFMMRIPYSPSGSNIHALLDEMRDEQLQSNPMSDDAFLDMYMLNPLQALRNYFLHSVVLAHIERIQQWGIDVNDIIKLKRMESNIHLNDVLERLYT
ncbi:hypothetical protein MH215_10430 [Paenibacillus sp. ACRSA]|uniref:hypothetical protein n=1 Tax=Paenibacillus sp. ACRSA TaxID=2918211 RepID=UPI001EF547FA|nr:hypothetical protein [Paenibacillus sp. ACRSA]MCG7377412.1 hypothetical protein [Paenibacillus sp. ACRSA]